jgi:hypothetical protein
VSVLVNLFVHCLYTQSLPSDQEEDLALIERSNERGEWTDNIPQSITNALPLAERISSPGFHAAVNNRLRLEWNNGLGKWFDILDVQTMAEALNDKVPQDRIVWQFLVDECCLTTGVAETIHPAEEKRTEEKLPREFLLRCVRRCCELVVALQAGRRQR